MLMYIMTDQIPAELLSSYAVNPVVHSLRSIKRNVHKHQGATLMTSPWEPELRQSQYKIN